MLVKCEIFLECGLYLLIVDMVKQAHEEDSDSEYVTVSDITQISPKANVHIYMYQALKAIVTVCKDRV